MDQKIVNYGQGDLNIDKQNIYNIVAKFAITGQAHVRNSAYIYIYYIVSHQRGSVTTTSSKFGFFEIGLT